MKKGGFFDIIRNKSFISSSYGRYGGATLEGTGE